MLRLLRLLPLLVSLLFSAVSHAGIAVIVHIDNYEVINEAQLRNLYLGKSKSFPSGEEVLVLDLARGHPAREQFIKKVLRRSEENLSAYWARMLFSSQGKPPKVAHQSREVLDIVAMDTSAIGYVLASEVDKTRVRVLMIFE